MYRSIPMKIPITVDQGRCEAAIWDKRMRAFRQCANGRRHAVPVVLRGAYGTPPVDGAVHVCGTHRAFLERRFRVMHVVLDNRDPDFWSRGFLIGDAFVPQGKGA
jgi:hypothetical protein